MRGNSRGHSQGLGFAMAGGRAIGLCPDPSLLLRLPYNEFFGGVSGLTVEQFQKINGFPNAFWGWGGEDDDLWNRYGFPGPWWWLCELSLARALRGQLSPSTRALGSLCLPWAGDEPGGNRGCSSLHRQGWEAENCWLGSCWLCAQSPTRLSRAPRC